MGERALAVVRGDDADHLYYSQWAGRHATRILSAPHRDRIAILLDADWQYRDSLAPTAVSHHVDTLTIEAVYLVSADRVTVFQPVWLGVASPDDAEIDRLTDGLLVHTATPAEFRRLRTTTQFFKGLLSEALRLDILDTEQARDVLALAVRAVCTPERIHTPGTPLTGDL